MARAKVRQAPQLVAQRGWAQGAGGALIGGIHHQNEIEVFKILRRQLASALLTKIIAGLNCLPILIISTNTVGDLFLIFIYFSLILSIKKGSIGNLFLLPLGGFI